MAGFYLLDHQNPNAPVRPNGKRGWYYTTRSKKISLIVMHVPVAVQDISGTDLTAEKVAQYFTGNSRPASAHVCIDRDSTVPCLPDSYTAFHVVNYNSQSLGVEQGWDYDDWGKHPDLDKQVIDRVAKWCAPRVLEYKLPLVKLSKAQVDAGQKGFTAHSILDPARRKDPGPKYPWTYLFERINALLGGEEYMLPLKQGDGGPGKENRAQDVKLLQSALRRAAGQPVKPREDGSYLAVDGIYGPGTVTRIAEVLGTDGKEIGGIEWDMLMAAAYGRHRHPSTVTGIHEYKPTPVVTV